ncbi:MAG: 50S ribosomal protein L20 [Elusimicrobia bacterium]|nr:50S ribosomal protein L20 [Elusimicrobiota bacterium]
MRVKRGQEKRKKHNRTLKAAKGYAHAKSHRYKSAINQLEKSLQYSTSDRIAKKREHRSLWILAINAACRKSGTSYSRFISGLKKTNINLNRKVLQEIALKDAKTFDHLISLSQKSK